MRSIPGRTAVWFFYLSLSVFSAVLAGLYVTDRISRAQKHGRIEYEV